MESKAGLTLWLIALACVAGGCLDERVVTCRDGLLCPEGTACDNAHRGCVLPEQLERCDGEPEGAACSYRGTRDGACYEGVCLPAGCGNGIADEGEVCDDGNRLHGDGCAADCRSNETCGNGVIDVTKGESCEPPGTAFCRADCVTTRCGDGVLDEGAFEQCDDGARNSDAPNAACRPNCQPQRCGDGIQDSAEVCDDGNLLNGDGCSYDCKSKETCGNGYLDLVRGEECDDENFLNHDGCSSTCLEEVPTLVEAADDSAFSVPRKVVYDASRDVLIDVFGPEELRGARWREIPSNSDARTQWGPGATWDAGRRRTVMFGGASKTDEELNDTLVWNGASWSVLPASEPAPSPRLYPSLAYDSVRSRTIMFGGLSEDQPLGDTWELVGNDWRQLSSASSPESGVHAMTFDPRKGVIVLFDGRQLWTLESETWMPSGILGPVPHEAAKETSLHFDSSRGALVLFVHPIDGQKAGLWELRNGRWVPREQPPVPANGLSFANIVLRTRNGRLTAVDEEGVREWTGLDWELRTLPTHSPTPYELVSHTMAYDPLSGRVLMHGGDSSGDTPCARSWTWVDDTWSPVEAMGPELPCYAPDAAYDLASRTWVMFGGSNSQNAGAAVQGATYEFDGSEWVVRPPQPGAPSARAENAMAYDVAGRRLLMFGGRDAQGGSNSELWEWARGLWTRLDTSSAPPARFAHTMVYDPINARMIIAGGETPADVSVDDAWSWSGAEWSPLESRLPSVLYRHAMVYDANRRSLVALTYNEEVWESSSVMNKTRLDWSVVAPYLNAAIWGHQAVYEAVRARTLIFGQYLRTTQAFSYSAPAQPDEACRFGFDTDGDSLIGCDDPDCWPFCTPLCPPGAPCDLTYPHCGDGECNDALETCRMCPEDCGACPALCGDFFCDAPETIDTCPGDCTSP